MSQKTSPAVHQALSNYIKFINKEVIEEFGTSYMTPENTGNQWRNKIEYSIKTEQFLITKSKLFIDMLDSRDSKSSNLSFLKPLINEISDYLSKYIVRGRNCNRNNATKEIKKALWDENRHIQYLITKQQQKKDASNSSTFTKKQKNIATATIKYNITQNIRTEFAHQKNNIK